MCHYQMRRSSVQDERRSSRPSIVASHVTRVLSGRPITINEIMVEFGLNHEDWIFSICSVICQWCLPDLFPAFSHHSKKNIKSKHQHWCCTFAMLMKTFFFHWLIIKSESSVHFSASKTKSKTNNRTILFHHQQSRQRQYPLWGRPRWLVFGAICGYYQTSGTTHAWRNHFVVFLTTWTLLLNWKCCPRSWHRSSTVGASGRWKRGERSALSWEVSTYSWNTVQ